MHKANIRRSKYSFTKYLLTQIFINPNIHQPEYSLTRIFVDLNIRRPEYSWTFNKVRKFVIQHFALWRKICIHMHISTKRDPFRFETLSTFAARSAPTCSSCWKASTPSWRRWPTSAKFGNCLPDSFRTSFQELIFGNYSRGSRLLLLWSFARKMNPI
jgi:hypothetical protein